MTAYYNEHDPFAAGWLRNLIAAGRIAPGEVDERDIRDVRPVELAKYAQCHFFAGIGGWSYALRLAGWPDDRPVWTGSCPCQPLSVAGLGKGHADERHLWPSFYRLIAKCKPSTLFGEQVAGKDGREWFAAVRADLEDLGYACGAADLCAAGIGAPHIRQRLFWVADTSIIGWERRERPEDGSFHDRPNAKRPESHNGLICDHQVGVGRLADTDGGNTSAERQQRSGQFGLQPRGDNSVGVADASILRSPTRPREPSGGDSTRQPQRPSSPVERPDSAHSFWGNPDWLLCRDGRWRPVEPGTFPLAHGIPARVGKLRAAGNAIVPQIAAAFIRATDSGGIAK